MSQKKKNLVTVCRYSTQDLTSIWRTFLTSFKILVKYEIFIKTVVRIKFRKKNTRWQLMHDVLIHISTFDSSIFFHICFQASTISSRLWLASFKRSCTATSFICTSPRCWRARSCNYQPRFHSKSIQEVCEVNQSFILSK